MRYFDFNLHFPPLNDTGASANSSESERPYSCLLRTLEEMKDSLVLRISGGNFMLFNYGVYKDRNFFRSFLKKIALCYPTYSLTVLLDFRTASGSDLECLSSCGVKAIKFHSYVQRIEESDFLSIITMAKRAEELGMFLCVDTSFGTSGMYRYDNLKLACALADEVSCPIVLLHSGGLRVMEAMLLAEEKSNIYLETSFSLPYYEGSTVEEDIVFVYKKLGASRLIYGSDYPYVSLEDSEGIALRYFRKSGFSDDEIQAIMYNNAVALTSVR